MGLIKTVTEKPWERKGVIGGMVPEGTFATESERVALTFFSCYCNSRFLSLHGELLLAHGVT